MLSLLRRARCSRRSGGGILSNVSSSDQPLCAKWTPSQTRPRQRIIASDSRDTKPANAKQNTGRWPPREWQVRGSCWRSGVFHTLVLVTTHPSPSPPRPSGGTAQTAATREQSIVGRTHCVVWCETLCVRGAGARTPTPNWGRGGDVRGGESDKWCGVTGRAYGWRTHGPRPWPHRRSTTGTFPETAGRPR